MTYLWWNLVAVMIFMFIWKQVLVKKITTIKGIEWWIFVVTNFLSITRERDMSGLKKTINDCVAQGMFYQWWQTQRSMQTTWQIYLFNPRLDPKIALGFHLLPIPTSTRNPPHEISLTSTIYFFFLTIAVQWIKMNRVPKVNVYWCNHCL